MSNIKIVENGLHSPIKLQIASHMYLKGNILDCCFLGSTLWQFYYGNKNELVHIDAKDDPAEFNIISPKSVKSVLLFSKKRKRIKSPKCAPSCPLLFSIKNVF